MDLGYKTLNNLTSKDVSLQNEAAKSIIDSKDIKAFEILSKKAEFIFDFIKDKIIKNLISKINKDNVFNLFDFMKIYSDDFMEFIIYPLIKFNSPEIEAKIFDLLKFGTKEEKAYAFEFLKRTKNNKAICYAKEDIKSDFIFLKNSAIKYLASLGEKEEFNHSIEILKSDFDDFEKLKAVEFLSLYGNSEGFYPVYNYLNKTGANEIVASNLLLIRGFNDLIKNDKNEEILDIYSVLLFNFPENITFDEIQFYNEDGVFDYLIESENNFSSLLIFYLREKLQNTLYDDSFALDFSGNTKKEAEKFLSTLKLITENFNKNEIINLSLKSNKKIEVLMALELSDTDNIEDIKYILDKEDDNEIILACLNKLKKLNSIQNSDIDKIKEKVQNKTVKLEVESFYS